MQIEIDAVDFENTYGAKGDLELSGHKTIANKPESMDLSGFRFTVKEGNENSDKIQALVKVLRSDEIKKFIEDTYDGAVIFYEK